MKTNQTVAKRRIRRPATTLLVLAAAAALVLAAVAGPALAQAPDGSRAKVRPFVCKAEVTFANPAASSLTVKVVKAKKSLVGTQITFTLAQDAKIIKITQDGVDIISLGAVAAGDRVVVHGRVDLTSASAPLYTARLILDRGPAPLK